MEERLYFQNLQREAENFSYGVFGNKKDIEKDLYFLLIEKSRGLFLLYFKITHLPWVEPSLRI